MRKNIPNILTIFRIILVPVFIWLFYFYPETNHLIYALIVFVVAEITDYFDGMLARKFNAISNFGKVMDPLADKLLTGAALIGLAIPPYQLISIVVVVIIILREVAVSILRQHYARKKVFIAANNLGKLKTISQMTGLTLTLVYLAFSTIENSTVFMIIYYYFWFVAILTAFSGAVYFLPLLNITQGKDES